jgi:hypothetical protein
VLYELLRILGKLRCLIPSEFGPLVSTGARMSYSRGPGPSVRELLDTAGRSAQSHKVTVACPFQESGVGTVQGLYLVTALCV